MLIPMKDIAKLVDYLEHDEREHFEEMKLNGENTRNHIFHAVVTVASWLDKQPRAPRHNEGKRPMDKSQSLHEIK